MGVATPTPPPGRNLLDGKVVDLDAVPSLSRQPVLESVG